MTALLLVPRLPLSRKPFQAKQAVCPRIGMVSYQGSALLVDAGRLDGKMDGWDGCWTAENTSCPCHETPSQANSQPIWTAGTANSQISDIESSNTHDTVYVSAIDKTKLSKQPSQPSTNTIDHLHKPIHEVDSTKKQPSPAVQQPSIVDSHASARSFYDSFCSQPGHHLRLREDDTIGIGVPDTVSDEEFERIEQTVNWYETELCAILQAQAVHV